jgi:hypothetical protein
MAPDTCLADMAADLERLDALLVEVRPCGTSSSAERRAYLRQRRMVALLKRAHQRLAALEAGRPQ